MQLNKNTKRKLALAIAAAVPVMSARQAFANNPIAIGDLVVYQVGSSITDTAQTSSSTLLMGELNPSTTGATTFVQQWDATTMTSPLFSGSAGSHGAVALSDNNTEVTFGGYTTSDPTDATNSTVRGVGVINLQGTYSQPATYTGPGNGDQIRSVFSPDGTNFYFGDKAGPYYNGGTTALVAANTRAIKGFGGATYGLTASKTSGVSVVEQMTPATPSNTAVTYTPLTGLINDNNAVDFYMVSSQNNGVFDTLYYTDTTAGDIVKYSLISGTWTAKGTDTTPGTTIDGIFAQQVPGGVNLFYTTSALTANGSQVFEVEDTSGQSGSLTNLTSPTLLYTAPTGDSLRGLVLVPEPASFGLMLIGGSLLALRRRRVPTA
jgi:hypothetical protein